MGACVVGWTGYGGAMPPINPNVVTTMRLPLAPIAVGFLLTDTLWGVIAATLLAIVLEITDHARDLLSDAGFDPAFGARPLKRVIQRELGDRLAVALLDGTVVEGGTVVVDAVDGEIAIK